MAGVDHAYRYSVEVKSRFSLFLDDSINNEDPDLLISKLEKDKPRKGKKDKAQVPAAAEPVEKEVAQQESNTKADTNVQVKAHRASKAKQPPSPHEDLTPVHVDEPKADTSVQPVRGRGGPRGFSRGFRGRGQGPRPQFEEVHGESEVQPRYDRDVPYEPRGARRGRGYFGRGRGGFDNRFSGSRGGPRMHPMPGREHEAEQPEQDAVENVTLDKDANQADEQPVTQTEPAADEPVNGDQAEEEEPKLLTLEEYKAMCNKTTVSLTTKETRKANDGKDVFKNMVAHKKLVEVSEDEVEEVERPHEEPRSIPIDVMYNDRPDERARGNRGFDRGRGGPGFRGGRPRGARGARGSFRGEGRGRGYTRGVGAEHSAPIFHSDQDFPSLK